MPLPPAVWYVRLTEHLGQAITSPHDLQLICVLKPRLFKKIIACSFASRRAESSSRSLLLIGDVLPSLNSSRISTITARGKRTPPYLSRKGISTYAPVSALWKLSSEGVAEAKSISALCRPARYAATSRTWYLGFCSDL